MKKQYLIITAVLAAVIAGLIVSMVLVKNEPEPETENNNFPEPDVLDSDMNEEKHRFDYIFTCLNSVAGHDERDTIVGNFTGHELDTLYIISVKSGYDTTDEWDEIRWQKSCVYYAVSNNRRIPKIELSGCCNASPKLVFEGDLDGNGTDEWGYLHTWTCSQWRSYCVFTLVNGKWRYLVNSDKLFTPMWLRCSGLEIIEPADKPGYVKIHYSDNPLISDIYDTVEKVTFSRIDD